MLNDIHIDYFYSDEVGIDHYCRGRGTPLDWITYVEKDSNKFGQMGCDSPPRLVKLMLDKLDKIEPDIDVIIISGDLISHGLSVELEDKDHDQYALLKEKIEDLLVDLIAKKFPNTFILPTIGNNDIKYHYVAPQVNFTAPDYYPFLYRTIFEKIPKNRELKVHGKNESFNTFGGYRVNYSDELDFIAFNSLYYNARTPSKDFYIKDAQFDWLESTLDNAKPGKKFVIFFHIYPGMYFIGKVRFFWETSSVLRFNDIIQRNSDKISLILGAHSHFPDMKIGFSHEFSLPFLLNNEDALLEYIPKWAMLITPSISPVFKNNPGFTLLNIEDQKANNISWHFMELYKFPRSEEEARFNTLDFKEDLGIDEFEPSAVLKFIKSIVEDRVTLYKYLAHKIGYTGKNIATGLAEYQELKMINLDEEYGYLCSLLNLLRTDYYF